MIKLYPVLVANSVSKNIIPGLLKSIERYALIYKLDELARDAKKSAGISLRKVGKKLVMKESDEQIVSFLTNEILSEMVQTPPAWHSSQRHGGGTKGSKRNLNPPPKGSHSQTGRYSDTYIGSGPDPEDEVEKAEKIAAAKERGKRQMMPSDASISIGQFDMQSIMLEPTWMKIDRVTKYGQKFTSVLGVKAVPVSVKSDATLAQLLTFDKQVGKMMHLILKFGRYFSGKLYRLYARTIQKMIDPDPEAISGDPYKDIVLKRTILQDANVDDVFLVLNQADLSEEFAISPRGIRKLMNLGWQSFCIADDVNRRLTFCMKEFKGMCHTLPYTMIYQSLDQAKVFEDLEDIRRASTSLFKTKIPMKKVLGESLAQQKLDEFGVELFGPVEDETQEFLNELSYIDENFATVAKKIMKTPKEFLTRFFKGNVKVPEITVERVLKIGKKIDLQFPKAYALAKRVISNSIKENVDERQLDWTAISIVIKAKTLPGKDLMVKTKDVLMSVIPVMRKGVRKAKQTTMNIPPQHRVEAVFGLIGSFGVLTALAFFYTWTIFKAKPNIEDAIKSMTDFFQWTSIKIKLLIQSGPYHVKAESKEITNFWSKLFTDSKPEFVKTIEGYKKEFTDFLTKQFGEGGTIENADDVLRNEYGMSFSELGALALLAVVGLYVFRFAMRPPR